MALAVRTRRPSELGYFTTTTFLVFAVPPASNRSTYTPLESPPTSALSKLLGRGKKPMVAIVTVTRKLLHAIYSMLEHNQDFEGEKFCRMTASAA